MEKRLASVAVSVNCQYGRPKRAPEIFANPQGVFGGEHEGDAFLGAARDGFGDDGWRVAGHGAGVAEAKVDVVAAIHVSEVRAVGGFHKNRKSAGPFFHPVHGDAAEEGGLCAGVESGGFGMVGDEAGFFAFLEVIEFGAINGRHSSRTSA